VPALGGPNRFDVAPTKLPQDWKNGSSVAANIYVDFLIADRGLQPVEVAEREHLPPVGVSRIMENGTGYARYVQRNQSDKDADHQNVT
jgi:hypothetical protein